MQEWPVIMFFAAWVCTSSVEHGTLGRPNYIEAVINIVVWSHTTLRIYGQFHVASRRCLCWTPSILVNIPLQDVSVPSYQSLVAGKDVLCC